MPRSKTSKFSFDHYNYLLNFIKDDVLAHLLLVSKIVRRVVLGHIFNRFSNLSRSQQVHLLKYWLNNQNNLRLSGNINLEKFKIFGKRTAELSMLAFAYQHTFQNVFNNNLLTQLPICALSSYANYKNNQDGFVISFQSYLRDSTIRQIQNLEQSVSSTRDSIGTNKRFDRRYFPNLHDSLKELSDSRVLPLVFNQTDNLTAYEMLLSKINEEIFINDKELLHIIINLCLCDDTDSLNKLKQVLVFGQRECRNALIIIATQFTMKSAFLLLMPALPIFMALTIGIKGRIFAAIALECLLTAVMLYIFSFARQSYLEGKENIYRNLESLQEILLLT